MARKIIIVAVCVVCCIIIISFASFVKSCNNMGDYELQVKNIKKQIPAATQFIEENKEFLDVLLAVVEKMRGYVAVQNIDEDITDRWLFEFYYSQEKKTVIITKNYSIFKKYGGDLIDIRAKALFSEYENYIIHETMSKKMSSGKNGNGRVPVILIYADRVRIEYAAYLLAYLTILSPPIEVEESDDYYEYSYGIKVNDDWGIYLERYGKAI